MSVAAQTMERPPVWPADLADAARFSGETGLDTATGPVLQLFRAVDQQTYDDRVGARFLTACDQLGAWAQGHDRLRLAETVALVAEEFQAVYDSPLDVDAKFVSLLWDRLGPELVRTSGEPTAVGRPIEGDGKVESDKPGDSTIDSFSGEPGETVASDQLKPRLVQVEDQHLMQAAEHAWDLYSGVHLLADLEREADCVQGGSRLADKIHDISRDLKTQAEAMKRSVATLRHVPAGPFLAEFTPLMERLANWLGKKIEVRIEGEDVLVERLLVDDLRSPLGEWLENTVRRRIDMPQRRLIQGKSETGALRLAAQRTNDRLRITVKDDGPAVDPTVISPATRVSALDDPASLGADLDCLPRLEALRDALRPYGGQVRFESDERPGATLSLDIPSRESASALGGLTLRQGSGTFVVPLEQVLEIVPVRASDVRSVQGISVITLHDITYEAHCLGDLLDMPRSDRAAPEPRAGVLVQNDDRQTCLIVDEILGQRQLVLRRMADIMPGMEQFHGVAPLADGRLAFVLNVAALLGRA